MLDKLETKSALDKRQKLIAATQELIAEKGYKNCTISDIANCAGVVDSIVYHYFVDKEDLLFSAYTELLIEAKKELDFHLKGIVDPLSKLGKIIWYHLHMNDHDSEFALLLKKLKLESLSRKNFYHHASSKVLLDYTGTIKEILREGVELGVFKSAINTSLVMEMIIGVLDAESLNQLLYGEVSKTAPDFDCIFRLIKKIVLVRDDQTESTVKKNKKGRILNSAKKAFAEYGYNKATIASISRQASVGEGTIYEHFHNKEDLFWRISNEQFVKYKKSMNQFLYGEGPIINLRKLIYFHFLHMSSDADFLMIYLHDLLNNKDFYSKDTYAHCMDYISDLENILDIGKRSGVFDVKVNNRIFRNLFLGTFSHLSSRWFVIKSRSANDMILELNQAVDYLCAAVTK